jgi:DUF177 domain-containing protein
VSLGPIDVSELLGHPGASKRATLEGTLDGLGTEVAWVPEDGPIHAELLLESVVEGILVSGELRGRFHLRCARCLDEFDAPFDVSVTEMFVPDPDEEADDYALMPEGLVDPEQMVRDAVGVELPFSPLCRPDCQGLCPVCGGNRNLGECPGDHPSADPRWAALEILLENTEN